MAFSYVLTLFMFFGGLFGAGNDLLDYVPAEAYWRLKSTPMTFETMADEARRADPAAAVNLAKVFQTSAGADRDRLALALIDQGESARAELDRLAGSGDADLAGRARACLAAIDQAPKARGVRRLMAIRTLGAMAKEEAVPLLQPLLASKEPFVSAYAEEAIASLQGKPALVRAFPSKVRDDIWRLPAECRAVAQIAPNAAAPELADRVLAGMNLPPGVDRADAIDGLTFTLVGIAERFGDLRFDGITLGGSADLGGNAGYCLAILRGCYDHAVVNRTLSDNGTAFNEFAGGRIYVPGGMAIYAPSDDLLIFAASPAGTSPVQAVITAAAGAPASKPSTSRAARASGTSKESAANGPDTGLRLRSSADMVSLIASVDTAQPVWLALKSGDAWRDIPGLGALRTLKLTGGRSGASPLELHLQATFADAAAAKDAASTITALLPRRSTASTQAGPAKAQASSSPLENVVSEALAAIAVNVDGNRIDAAATLALARADVIRLLLTSMDRPREHKDGN